MIMMMMVVDMYTLGDSKTFTHMIGMKQKLQLSELKTYDFATRDWYAENVTKLRRPLPGKFTN